MRLLVLAVAGFVIAGSATIEAQGLRGPRELPPSGFSGQQFTDSAGCVLLRAGVSGRTTWVARIGSNRRQLCGYPPSFRAPPATAVAEAPPATRAPAPTVASAAAPSAIRETPRPATVPAASYAVPPVAAPAKAPADTRTAGCPATSPYGSRVTLADGRRALVCVRSPDRLAGYAARVTAASAPAAAPAPAPVERAAVPQTRVATSGTAEGVPLGAAGAGPRVACPPSTPYLGRYPTRDGGTALICSPEPSGATAPRRQGGAVSGAAPRAVALADAGVVVPKGYRLAWSDDRLNPRRGQGTAAGQVAQDQVWTRDIPAVAQVPATRVVTSASNAPKRKAAATLSASGAPRAPQVAATGRHYVQVGSFGVPANADRARGRLAGLGMPVSAGRGSIKGKPVQVVFAGPFGSAGEAQAALAAARRAGFGDAFIR